MLANVPRRIEYICFEMCFLSLTLSRSLPSESCLFLVLLIHRNQSIVRIHRLPKISFALHFSTTQQKYIFIFNVRRLRMMKNGVAVDCRYIGRKFMELKKQR